MLRLFKLTYSARFVGAQTRSFSSRIHKSNFELPKSFLKKYEGKRPANGFDIEGAMVAGKNFARMKPSTEDGKGPVKESWRDVVQRVVEGTYKYVDFMTEAEKKAMAERTFDAAYNCEFLPAGRGLFSMGTAIMEKGLFEALNNCVTKDTWVMTTMGPRQVKDIVGQKVDLFVDGKVYSTTDKGFFKTGERPTLEIKLLGGYSIRLTEEHKVLVVKYEYEDVISKNGNYVRQILKNKTTKWVEAKDLKYNTVVMNNQMGVRWDGSKTFEEGVEDGRNDKWLDVDDEKNTSYQYQRGYIKGLLVRKPGVDGFFGRHVRGITTDWPQFAQRILYRLGVLSLISPRAKDGGFSYWCDDIDQNNFLVTVDKESFDRLELILDRDQCEDRGDRLEEYTVQVEQVIPIEKPEEVYDVEVPGINAFDGNGLYLHNCGFISTKDLNENPTESFEMIMDLLMLGVGVGSDTRGEGKCRVVRPKIHPFSQQRMDNYMRKRNVSVQEFFMYIELQSAKDYRHINDAKSEEEHRMAVFAELEKRFQIFDGAFKEEHPEKPEDLKGRYGLSNDESVHEVEDSREGWVEAATKLLLGTFLKTEAEWEKIQMGEVERPLHGLYSYSRIREKGIPLKGFGGVSGGPGCLVDLIRWTRWVLFSVEDGSCITSRMITDIINMIGACVSAGNIRRSAQILLGDMKSEEFINLKNYHENPERSRFGWASNNSVIWNDEAPLMPIAQRIHDNGEPGIVFLDTMKRYGRLIDPPNEKDAKALGVNPCVTSDTWVLTTEGPKQVLELIDKPFEAIVQSESYKTSEKGFFHTGKKRVLRVYTQEGHVIRLTRNHKIMTVGGEWVDAGELFRGSVVLLHHHIHVGHQMDMWKGEGNHQDGISDSLMYVKDEENLRISNYERKSMEYYGGFLLGFFRSKFNASLVDSHDKGRPLWKATLRRVEDAMAIQRMMLRVGILTFWEENKETNNIEVYMPNESFVVFHVLFVKPGEKLPTWFCPNRYNNMFVAVVDRIEKGDIEDVYDVEVPGVNAFDGNGFYLHNCGEQTLEDKELCNLVEIFIPHMKSLDHFLSTIEVAYLYGKVVSNFPSRWPKIDEVIKRNRRMGVSITGVVQFYAQHGENTLKEYLDKGYKHIKKLDEEYSKRMKVPQSIKMTTVKPSGTLSLVGGVTAACNFPYTGQYYIRRIIVDGTNPLIQTLEAMGYPIEPSLYSKGAMVVSFPKMYKEKMRKGADVPVREQMDIVALVQAYWADNNVSATVVFDKETLGTEELAEVILEYKDKIKCISFLPSVHGYSQIPYEEITKEEYDDLVSRISSDAHPDIMIPHMFPKQDAESPVFCDSLSCTRLDN